MKIRVLFLLIHLSFYSQTVTLNEDFVYNTLRDKQLKGEFRSDVSFTLRPLESHLFSEITKNLYSTILTNKSKSISVKNLPINMNFELNSKHPYNRNNGSMIPNRGLQTIVSGGIFLKAGPLNIQLKPEYHFAENKNFDGFWEGHYPIIWAKRYRLWNKTDIPERHGFEKFSRLLLGQSSLKLNYKK